MRRIHQKLAAAWIVASLAMGTLAWAQPRKEIREDRKERREDRKELREDKKELREDKKELREDKKDGASKEEIREDKKEIAEDKKEIADDKKELRGDRKEIRADLREKRQQHRKELREKWGDMTKRADFRAELKVHARRIARLDHARKVADEAGKKEVVARIDKLIQKENARHSRAMDQLKAKTPGGTP